MPPECRHLGPDDGEDWQVHEPNEEAGPKVQVESGLLAVSFEHKYFLELVEEPGHDEDAEGKDQISRPCLPLVRVRDEVNLHLWEQQHLVNPVSPGHRNLRHWDCPLTNSLSARALFWSAFS